MDRTDKCKNLPPGKRVIMVKLVGLFMMPTIAALSYPPDDAALRLVEDFVAAVQHSPERAKEFVADGVAIGFGDFIGGRRIDRFANETRKCQLQSISQPAVPVTWKLDGARYFSIVWRCPPPYRPRDGAILTVSLFVKQKIVAAEGRFTG